MTIQRIDPISISEQKTYTVGTERLKYGAYVPQGMENIWYFSPRLNTHHIPLRCTTKEDFDKLYQLFFRRSNTSLFQAAAIVDQKLANPREITDLDGLE
jgi:hypothetical protein